MIDRYLVLVGDDGEFQNAGFYAAWKGFSLLGRDVRKAKLHEIEEYPASPRTLVFGGIEAVYPYLQRLGCIPPELDYPVSLHPYLGRDLRTATLADIRRSYRDQGSSVFIKPIQHKLFKGQVVSCFRDLIGTASWPDETPIYVLGHVEFVSEWRCYLRGNEIVGTACYKGDPLVFPDHERIQQAVADFARAEEIQACGLDFGVTRAGDTLLVEVNDMCSLGSYGLDPGLYATMIYERWIQLVSG